MAMKKKFLGLAMAAMVALPATGVYAATVTNTTGVNDTTQQLEMDVTDTGEVTVPVTGTVENKQGQKPQKIEVLLPSKMAFTVDKNGNFLETEYAIENNSDNVDIKLSVGGFKGGLSNTDGTGDGIQLISKDVLTTEAKSTHFRNQVSLVLTNTDETGKKEVDLGNYSQLNEGDKALGTIKAGKSTKVKLTGIAGTKDSTTVGLTSGTDVDSKGAQDDFELVFSIKR